MDENTSLPPEEPHGPVTSHFPTGKKELRLCAIVVILSVLLADFVIYGGFYLGFAVVAVLCIVAAAVYLLRSGCRLTRYSGALLGLSLVIAASFVRSNDGFVKFVMFCFLMVSAALGLCLLAGKNSRDPAGVTSLLDVPLTIFGKGVGKLEDSLGGLNDARKNAGPAGKKRTAVLIGLAVAVPIVAVLIPLLMSADAAFEGLLNLLPEIDLSEPLVAVILGTPIACCLYTMCVALKHAPEGAPRNGIRKGLNPLTVNTALGAVCAVYLVYLVSQLAYFVGGFSGILPEEFTMAEYARRGFFEMAWLSAINLGLMTLAVGLVEHKNGRAPLTTRCLALFIGVVTLFFVVTASAKMLMYIDSYGLTRLRVLTEVIMVFIGLTTVFVSLWLFLPKFAYMKAVLLTALVMGAAVAWADVDTVVAAYNVRAYQTGALETVDVAHLSTLSDGAVPYIRELTLSTDPDVASGAVNALRRDAELYYNESPDLRSYNIATAIANEIWENFLSWQGIN